MEWSQAIAAAELRIKESIKKQLAQLFLFTQIASVNSTGATAVESSDQGVDPGAPSNEKKSQRPVTSIFPFGLISVPVRKLRGLAMRLGTSNVLLFGIAATQKYGPQNLDEGETALYAQPGQTFVLDKNGNLIATPAGTGTVQIGGNSYSLPQWDSFAAVLKTATAAITGLTPATDLASVILVANGIRTAIVAVNSALAANNNYKSTLAKNG